MLKKLTKFFASDSAIWLTIGACLSSAVIHLLVGSLYGALVALSLIVVGIVLLRYSIPTSVAADTMETWTVVEHDDQRVAFTGKNAFISAEAYRRRVGGGKLGIKVMGSRI